MAKKKTLGEVINEVIKEEDKVKSEKQIDDLRITLDELYARISVLEAEKELLQRKFSKAVEQRNNWIPKNIDQSFVRTFIDSENKVLSEMR